MSKGQMLRVLVNERLTAAAEEIFALFERTIAEYEAELCRSKEENQRKQLLVDWALRAGVNIPSTSPGPDLNHGLSQEPPQTALVKEEAEEESVRQEEEQVPQSGGVCVKTEESSLLQQRQTEHREETQREDYSVESPLHSDTEEHLEHASDTDNEEDWRAPFSFSDAQMKTEADEDHYDQVDRSTATQYPGLFPNYRSAPEMSATVYNGDMSGTAAGPERKKHQCFVCEKTFKRKQTLQQHMRVHTGERPFSCSICKRRFSRRGNLDQHIKIHTGEKPFSCLICKKTFNRKSILDLHIKIHTGEKPFSCSTCKKTFTRKSTLDKHTNTHKQETNQLLNL